MASFVLVHGAWHGGWCWAPTEMRLRDMGHTAISPTLTGLGERSHLLSPEITAQTHVTDIVNCLHWRDLDRVILVGHSYGGVVITGVAAQIAERLRAMVYLDAFVPEESGASVFGSANPERMARFQAQIDAGATAVEPDLFDAWTDDPDTKAWLKSRCTPHPVSCLAEGVALTGRENEVAHKHYILCARNKPSAFWTEFERTRGRPGWTHDRIDAKHDAMVDNADALATRLDAFARSLG